MPKFFVKNNQIENNTIQILGTDVNHIKNVLRLKENDEIEICDSDEQQSYLCKIIELEESFVKCDIVNKIEESRESNIEVTIFQGLPKADKMELIIQKSVELGVYDITPVEMARCVVKLNDKDKTKKIERWNKISEVAAKQSQRDIIPKINNIIKISELANIISQYDGIILAYEKEKDYTIKQELQKLKMQNAQKIGIVIGPEGGLEEKEVEMLKNNGASVITLGKRILRTETVALNVLSNIIYEFEM
ncbi:MAG: 16S rRNA (uracil(1498)-N(3))-methyltransferase [Clostridia bacterium]|nr:16S rRNA (uracil(1498)-N(3))-methyltransferase [Clostridia bacterium]